MPPRIYILALSSFAVGTQAFVFGGMLVQMAQELGVSVAAVGQLATIYALTFAVAAPLIGSQVAGLERRRLLVGSLCVLAALNVAAAFTPGFEALAGLRVLCALVATMIVPVAAAAAASLAPPEARGRAMAVVMGGMTLALVAGIPLGSLVGELFGWRACFLFAAAVTAAGALGIGAVMPHAPSRDRPGVASLGVAFETPVLLHLLVSCASLASIFCITTYLAPMVVHVTGLSVAAIGAMQVCSGLGAMAGVVWGGRNADGEHPQRWVAVAYVLLFMSLSVQAGLMFVFGPDAPGGDAAIGMLAATFFVSSMSMFSIMPTVQRRLVETASRAQNVVMALNGSMVFFGQALGGALGGAAISSVGIAWTAVAGAAMSVVAMSLFQLAVRSHGRHAARQVHAGAGRGAEAG